MENVKEVKSRSSVVEFIMMFMCISVAPLMMLDFTITHLDHKSSNSVLGFMVLSTISIMIMIYTSGLMVPEFRKTTNVVKVLELVLSILMITSMYSISIYVISTAFLY